MKILGKNMSMYVILRFVLSSVVIILASMVLFTNIFENESIIMAIALLTLGSNFILMGLEKIKSQHMKEGYLSIITGSIIMVLIILGLTL